tara:strand:+ start:1829 stop:3718 length:1890 start_codon:yes stop_codon:yes gene_type:complete
MDVSLAALRGRLYALRSWDSTGTTLDNRIRAALNLALDRIAGDIPEALVPDEEHIVLLPDVDGGSETVAAKVATYDSDKRLLFFVDSASVSIAASASKTSWTPTVTGEWDGIMHLEITDSTGRIRRRQSREWFKVTADAVVYYVVSLDRPMPDIIPANGAQSFRIHQPEFFFSDDVMEVLEPAKIYDGSRQKVSKIATSVANRDDLFDFQGSSSGRPHTCWRNRHFQIPAPTQAPAIVEVDITKPKLPPQTGKEVDEESIVAPPDGASSGNSWSALSGSSPSTGPITYDSSSVSPGGLVGEDAPTIKLPEPAAQYKWSHDKSLRSGTWAIRYTYVWGRRDDEFQQSPSVAPGGDQDHDSSFDLAWAYETGSVTSTVSRYTGINDPVWESAPSPVTLVEQKNLTAGVDGALVISSNNIDAMLGFGDSNFSRFSRSGMRIRYYVAHIDKTISGRGEFNSVEVGEKFYLLCEVEPTFDHVAALTSGGTTAPAGLTSPDQLTGGRVVWNGSQLYDYYRPLKHSTGYYAWQVYPQQDQRYELDFRVLRLPRKFVDAQDTAPIQRDAVPCLVELALYYVSLDDGNDQTSAQAHLNRYHELMRGFRDRYANTGGAISPVPFTGHRDRSRYGTFGSE